MKSIYKLILGVIFITGSFNVNSQDIRFIYEILEPGDVVQFSIRNDGAAAENFMGFTINFYYNLPDAMFVSRDFTAVEGGTWGWGTSNVTNTPHEVAVNPAVPIPHSGYYVYQNFDNDFVGDEIAPGATFVLGTVTFDKTIATQDMETLTFFATIAEQPGLTYYGVDFDEHDELLSGANSQPLPITLSRFEVTKINDKSARLDWTSTTEINSDYFEVQRSQDGINFETIGKVNAAGNSNSVIDYNFLDETLPLNQRSFHKTFYYRLNMVDIDGAQEYSQVRSVRFDQDGEGDFLVYPNPALNEVYVNLSNINADLGAATLQITNANGQIVKQINLATSDDIRVDISDLTSGVYQFITVYDGQKYGQQVIKID